MRSASAGEPKQAACLEQHSVSITLSATQVDQVVRAALGGHLEDGLLAGDGVARLTDGRLRDALNERYRSLQSNRRLSRSLLAGLLVLSCFSCDGQALGINEIAERLRLNSSTVHRYVATLLAAGLLERDPDTRRYRLQPD